MTRPRLERSYFSISWQQNVLTGPMEALSKRSILWLLWGRGQMMSTWFSRAKVMTSRCFVCEYCPSGTEIQGSYFIGFVCLMKWRNRWVKISLCIHPEKRRAWTNPGGVPFISSCFIYFLGNTSNGGMKCPVGLKQVTIVTRDPPSADWIEDIWRLPFNPNIFVCLCCRIVMPVLSHL